MLSHVRHTHQSLSVCAWVHVHARACPRVCTFLCRRLRARVRVFDWHVVDLLGTAFSLIRCLSTADDWQLICGPEISVLEKELSRRCVTSKPNWSHLVRFLWQNMCVRLVMRTGQAFSHEGGHHPQDIHTVAAPFWTSHRTCVNSIRTLAFALFKTASKSLLIDA